MQLTADFHSHSNFSDGHCEVEEQFARARELGLRALALTDHGFTHRLAGLRKKQFGDYCERIVAAGKKYGVTALVGIEENVLGREGSLALSEEELSKLDILLVGCHVMSRHERFKDFTNGWLAFAERYLRLRGGKGLVADQTKCYIQTVRKHPVDILTHLNYRCFSDAVEVAKCCADFGTYLELSGRKNHLSDGELDAIVNHTEVRFVLDSDAHRPERLGDVSLAEAQIARVGVPLWRIDNIDGRLPVFRFAEYKKRNL